MIRNELAQCLGEHRLHTYPELIIFRLKNKKIKIKEQSLVEANVNKARKKDDQVTPPPLFAVTLLLIVCNIDCYKLT